jgi:ribosome-associated protein
MEKITFNLRETDMSIHLIQLLKAANVVYSGSEAQQLVTSGQVKRNGQVELRKRAQIVAGDCIEVSNIEIMVV